MLLPLLFAASAGGPQALAAAAASPPALRVSVDAAQRLGPAGVLADYLNVQGVPRDMNDPAEAAAWRALAPGLGFGTESLPLINDAGYMGEGGIQVFRSEVKQDPLWRGPYGPGKDLWLAVEDFQRQRRQVRRSLGLGDDRISYAIAITPRALCYQPESPNCLFMAPRRYDEWADVMRGIAEYLASIDLQRVRLSFFGEPESGYLGKGRAKPALPEVAADYAEHYYVTHEAIRAVLPEATIAGPAHGTVSEEITRELQQNPEQWGLESTLRELAAIDPEFIPKKLTALAIQGYLFETSLYGHGDFRWAIQHVRSLLDQYSGGSGRHIPIEVHGWNGTWVVDPRELPEKERPELVRLRLEQEAAFLVASTFDFLSPGGARGYDVGYYYTWDLEDGCAFPASLVSTIHPEDPPWDPEHPECHTPESPVACPRATYRAMQMLDSMRTGGDLAATRVTGGDDDLVAAATVRGAPGTAASLRLLLAERQGQSIPQLTLEASGLAPRRRYRPVVRVITSTLDLCAETVELALPGVRSSRDGKLRLILPELGAGLVQVVLTPAG
jgi:hypothetical protein